MMILPPLSYALVDVCVHWRKSFSPTLTFRKPTSKTPAVRAVFTQEFLHPKTFVSSQTIFKLVRRFELRDIFFEMKADWDESEKHREQVQAKIDEMEVKVSRESSKVIINMSITIF